MSEPVAAVYDGQVLRPEKPLELEPNTRVLIHIEAVPAKSDAKGSFLNVARSLQLEGPPDWSENIESYLYGSMQSHEP